MKPVEIPYYDLDNNNCPSQNSSRLRAARTVVGSSPEPPPMCRHVCRYVDQKDLAAMLIWCQQVLH